MDAIDALVHRRDQLEREITTLLATSPWQVQAGRLRCLRGIDTLTAVGLCAEIGPPPSLASLAKCSLAKCSL